MHMNAKMKISLAAATVSVSLLTGSQALATLTAGDVAVVGRINNGSPDSFAIAALNTLTAGEVLYFTDNGWTGAGYRGAITGTDGDGNENLLQLTINSTIPFGTIIQTSDITNPAFTFTKTGPVPGGTSGTFADLALGQGGEQITILQNSNTNLPLHNLGTMTPIYQFDDTAGFENATDSSTGNLIPGMTLGSTAVALNNTANIFVFNTTALASGTKSQWLTAIADPLNWSAGSQLPSGVLGIPGPASLNWNTGSTFDTSSNNWLSGGNPAMFTNGDSIGFTDVNVGTVNVISGIAAGAMTVSHTAGTYEFTGNGFTATGYDQTGGGTVILSGTGGYDLTGANKLNIKNGTLKLNGGNNNLATDTAVLLGQTATSNVGILDLNGTNQTLFSIEENGSGASKVTSATAATLTINNSSQGFVYDGAIDGPISLVLVSNNTGSVVGRTMTLTGASSYTGTTTVTGATLRINDPGALAGGNVTINNFGALRLQPADNTTVTYGTGSQTITINGIGNQLSTELDGDSGALRLAGVGDGMTGNVVLNSNVTLGSNSSISIAQGSVPGTSNMLEIAGVVSDGGNTLRKQGNGKLKLTNAGNSMTGNTIIGNGAIEVGASSSMGTGSLTIANTEGNAIASPFNITTDVVTGVTLNNAAQTIGTLSNSWLADSIDFGKTAETSINLNGTALTINQTGNTEYGVLPASLVNGSLNQFSVKITGTGSIAKAGTGTLTISSTNTYTGSTSVTGGKLITKTAIKNGAALNVTNGALEVPANGTASGVTSVSSVTTGATGLIDLHDNDLVVDYGANTSSYNSIVNQVKSGLVLLGGSGTGGIGSSDVDNQTIAGAMLAVVDDGDANIAGAITEISGFTIASPTSSVLVKYTWFGDSNLDGVVDGSDYALIDTGFTAGGTLGGWVFGDYDYSGVIDGSDYALIDTGFISQTGALPEPATLGILGLGAMSILRRRRGK